MHIDRQIAIWASWIAGPAFGVAMMAAPFYLDLGRTLAAVLFWGGTIIFFLTVVVLLGLSVWEAGRRKRILGPWITIALGLMIAGGGVAWLFWPGQQQRVADRPKPPAPPTLAEAAPPPARRPQAMPAPSPRPELPKTPYFSKEEKEHIANYLAMLRQGIDSLMLRDENQRRIEDFFMGTRDVTLPSLKESVPKFQKLVYSIWQIEQIDPDVYNHYWSYRDFIWQSLNMEEEIKATKDVIDALIELKEILDIVENNESASKNNFVAATKRQYDRYSTTMGAFHRSHDRLIKKIDHTRMILNES